MSDRRFQVRDLAGIFENPAFMEFSFDERSRLVEKIIADASAQVRQSVDYDAESQRMLNAVIDKTRARLAGTETFGEELKWAAGTAWQTAKDSVKVTVATLADMGVVADNAQTGELELKAPLGTVGKGLATSYQGLAEAGATGINSLLNSEESQAVESQIQALKKRLDEADYPVNDPAALKAWLKEQDAALLPARQRWLEIMNRGNEGGAEKAREHAAARSLTTDPELLDNLVAYMTVRAPGSWDAVRKGLLETPTTARLNENREAIKGGAVGRALEGAGIGADMAVAAGDILDNAVMNFIPIGKGAALATKGLKAGALGAAKGIATETASEVGSLFAEDPLATSADVLETAKAGSIGAGGLAAMGAAGGAVKKAIAGDSGPEAATPEGVPVRTTPPAQTPAPPPDTTATVEGRAYMRRGGLWMEPQTNTTTDPANDWRALNPADPVDAAIIVRAEVEARRAPAPGRNESAVRIQDERDALLAPSPEPGQPAAVSTGAANSAAPPIMTGAQPPGPSGGKESGPVITTAPAGEAASGQSSSPPRPPAAKTASLPDPSGADLITRLQNASITLRVTDGPEWDWFRELEREAAQSPLKKQEAAARARRGEVDGTDAQVTLAWLEQNGVLSRDRGSAIDEAAETLSDTGQIDETDPNASAPLPVAAGEIGPGILTAIQARARARQQADPAADLEREQVEAERATARRLLTASARSTGPEFTGLRLANTLADGDTLTIAGEVWTAAEVDPDTGTLALTDSQGRSTFIREGDTLRAEAINDQAQIEDAAATAEDVDAPFSLAGASVTDGPGLVQAASEAGNRKIWQPLPLPENQRAEMEAATGQPMSGFRRMADIFAIRHIRNRHGVRSNDPHPITDDELANLEAILTAPGAAQSAGRTAQGREAIMHVRFKDGWFYYLEEIRQGNQILALVGMRKAPYRTVSTEGAMPSETSSETRSDAQLLSMARERLQRAIEDFKQRRGDAFSYTPDQAQSKAGALPRDPAKRIAAVESALFAATGLKRLDPARVEVVHDTAPASNGRHWKARVQGGKVTINAAFIDSAADALWNLEHELAHESYRGAAKPVQRAWKRLIKALSAHPDIRAEVEALRYSPDAMPEEMAVRLAQKLDAQGPWSEAWAALKEAVWNFFKGKWGGIATNFTDRVAAALAARAIMADARSRLTPQTGAEMVAWLATPEAAAFSFQPSDLLPDGTPRPEVLAGIEAEKAEIKRRAQADGTWMKAPNGQPSKLNEAQWLTVRTRRFKEWFGDWEAATEQQRYDRFLDRMLTDKSFGGSMTWRAFDADEITAVQQLTGLDASGFTHEINANQLRHARNEHPDLTEDDLRNLPQVLDAWDYIEQGTPKKGFHSVRYVKQMPGGVFYYVERLFPTSKDKSPRGVNYTAWKQSGPSTRSATSQSQRLKYARSAGTAQAQHPFTNGRVNPDSVSKVVDENGEPLVVWHASPHKFTAFDLSKRGAQTGNSAAKKGFFFGQDQEALADIYGTNADGTPADGQMVGAFLNLKAPKEYHVESLVQFDRQYGTDAYAGDAIGTMGDPAIGTFPFVWVATNSSQIKSATANTGTYFTESGDIRYSFAPEPPPRPSSTSLSIDSTSTASTLPAHENPDHHRSKKNVRALLESAARLSGADAPVYFGPKSQSKLPDARQSQLAALAQEPEAAPPPGDSPAFVGGEHTVFEVESKTAVLKHTLPGFYGRTLDEATLLDPRTFQNRPRLILRGALPSEYLRRWAVLTDIFGLPTTYQGRAGTNAAEPQMVVAQPYIEQDDADPPTADDVTAFMDAHGFSKVDPASVAIPEVADVTWYRQRDGILITDAHPRNFRKAAGSGVIVPIDLVVTTIPRDASQVLPQPLAEWQPDQDAATGRAQPLDAPVLTPDGWRPIGSLAVGDALASTDGAPSTVTGIYPQGRSPVFKITLADGRTVRATEDHLWKARVRGEEIVMPLQTRALAWHAAHGVVELPVMEA